MDINLAVSTQSNYDGTYKAIIVLGNMVSEEAALKIAISGGSHLVDVLRDTRKDAVTYKPGDDKSALKPQEGTR